MHGRGLVVPECKWEVQFLLISSFKRHRSMSMSTSTDASPTPSTSSGLTRKDSRRYRQLAYILLALKFHSCNSIALELSLRVAGGRSLFKRQDEGGNISRVPFGLCYSWLISKLENRSVSGNSFNFFIEVITILKEFYKLNMDSFMQISFDRPGLRRPAFPGDVFLLRIPPPVPSLASEILPLFNCWLRSPVCHFPHH